MMSFFHLCSTRHTSVTLHHAILLSQVRRRPPDGGGDPQGVDTDAHGCRRETEGQAGQDVYAEPRGELTLVAVFFFASSTLVQPCFYMGDSSKPFSRKSTNTDEGKISAHRKIFMFRVSGDIC